MWEGKEELKLFKKAIEISKETNGYITAADLCLTLEIPMTEAEAILERLVNQGLATASVEDTGSLVYDIPRARTKETERTRKRNLA
jgi:hypothetical protein